MQFFCCLGIKKKYVNTGCATIKVSFVPNPIGTMLTQKEGKKKKEKHNILYKAANNPPITPRAIANSWVALELENPRPWTVTGGHWDPSQMVLNGQQ